jgi:dTMP kinase
METDPVMRRGVFFSFEGIDGCGKTIQAERLAAKLSGAGIAMTFLREPGGTAVSERIRDLLLDRERAITSAAELFLYEAARAQLVWETIEPALESGQTVVADRFADSTLAYQGFGRGLDLDFIRRANAFAAAGIEPDRTYYLDVPVAEAASRMRAAGKRADRLESEGDPFFIRIREGFTRLADEAPDRVIKVDGTGSIEAVEEAIWEDAGRVLRSHGYLTSRGQTS